MKKKIKDLFNLKNQVIVITGGSGFLGSVFALTLSNIGAIPIVLDKNKNSLQLLKKKFIRKKQRGSFFLTNLNDENKINVVIDLIIKKYRKIDCLINAAGFTGDNFQLWQKSLEGNLSGVFVVTKSVAKHMIKRKKGSIINIASDVGVISPDHRIYEANKKFNYKGVNFNTPISYSVAKSGIISMTRYLATYWAKKGIRVNCISPAGVYKKHDKKFVEQLSQRIPLGRMAKSHELNGAIIYLCSNASSFVTGHNLVIDGGRTIW